MNKKELNIFLVVSIGFVVNFIMFRMLLPFLVSATDDMMLYGGMILTFLFVLGQLYFGFSWYRKLMNDENKP